MTVPSTPNHEARREELVRAAMAVLRTEGLAGCSARAIADASPLTKSALHYYFDDVTEIVDLAFSRLMDQFLARVTAAAAAATDPAEALWAAARAYLVLGGDRPDRVPMLWFEVQVDASRRARTGLISELTDRALDTFAELIGALGVEHPRSSASTFFSALIGSVVRASMRPADPDAVLDELATALALPVPVPVT